MRCEACGTAPAPLEIAGDEANEVPPFRVCARCAHRIQSFSLRPLEWFNLAAVHGPVRELHDDFYDQDGTAYAAQEPVEDASSLAPSLAEATAAGLERLVDFAMSRWFVDAELETALQAQPPAALLAAVVARVAGGAAPIEARAYEICALGVGPVAEQWIRERWDARRGLHWWPLAQALAACLPPGDGLTLALGALGDAPGSDRAGALAFFRSARVLDWMEERVREAGAGGWGRLAAASALDWPRAAAWLERGRPLSLVALDALLAIAKPDTGLLERLRPALGRPPAASEFRSVLEACAARDPSPRVKRCVRAIMQAGWHSG
jgi:hypothetical protein